jgi:hypothetical protein
MCGRSVRVPKAPNTASSVADVTTVSSIDPTHRWRLDLCPAFVG